MVDSRENRAVTQASSRTAVLGYLAAAAAGQRLDRPNVAAWFKRHGLAIGDHGLRDALKLRRTRRGHAPQRDLDPAERGWIRDGFDVDATKLDLDLAVVVFPGADPPEQLSDVLRSIERVIRVYKGYDRDLVAVIIYNGARERRRLQTLLEEHEPRLRWIVVREVDDTSAASAWLSLARQVASQERFLTR
jgi:hypothetical protein